MIEDTAKILPVEILIPDKWYKKPLYRLLDPIYSRHADVFVPIGFVSDGATTFRFIWWLFPPVSKYLLPAIIHDYLLKNNYGWHFSNRVFVSTLKDNKVHPTVVKIFKWSTTMYGHIKHYTRGDSL